MEWQEAVSDLRRIFKDVQGKFHDQWDWMEAEFAVTVLETYLNEGAKEPEQYNPHPSGIAHGLPYDYSNSETERILSGERDWPSGTFACPICGRDFPHQHTTEQIAEFRTRTPAKAPPVAAPAPNEAEVEAAVRELTRFSTESPEQFADQCYAGSWRDLLVAKHIRIGHLEDQLHAALKPAATPEPEPVEAGDEPLKCKHCGEPIKPCSPWGWHHLDGPAVCAKRGDEGGKQLNAEPEDMVAEPAAPPVAAPAPRNGDFKPCEKCQKLWETSSGCSGLCSDCIRRYESSPEPAKPSAALPERPKATEFMRDKDYTQALEDFSDTQAALLAEAQRERDEARNHVAMLQEDIEDWRDEYVPIVKFKELEAELAALKGKSV